MRERAHGLITRRGLLAAGAATSLAAPAAMAERGFPSRPVSVIVPFPAGGTTDTLVRALTRLAAPALGRLFVLDNKPGGGTLIAAQALARARPDGHTIGVVPMSINRLRVLGRTTLDVTRDFSFIARLAGQTHGLVARADSELRSIEEVVRTARERPGELTYGSSGVASITHVAMTDFAQRAGIQLRHIPFKGGTESLRALRGGLIDLMAESPLWLADVMAGHCRLLATWNEQRLARFPMVPTMAELGHPQVFEALVGLGGPAGMAPAVLSRLREVFQPVIQGASFQAECERLLAMVRYLDGEAFRAYALANLHDERETLRRLRFNPE